MKEFGCNAIRCRIHILTRVEDISGHLCLIGFHDRCMTDWAHANLVSSSMLHQLDRSDRSQQRPAQSHPPKQEYRIKKKEGEAQPMQVDSGKTITSDVVQISDVNMVVKDVEKRLMVFDKSVDPRNQKLVMADNYKASSSSTDQYSQPRWCPPGLTHTQKRRLQRLRRQEQKEQEAERLRDEQLNKYKPIFPQSKVWRVKSAN